MGALFGSDASYPSGGASRGPDLSGRTATGATAAGGTGEGARDRHGSTRPRDIPWIFAVLQAALMWGGFTALVLDVGDDSALLSVLNFALMVLGGVLGSLVDRHYIGAGVRVDHSGRYTLTMIALGLVLLALAVVPIFWTDSPWSPVCLIITFVLVIVLLRCEDIDTVRRAREGHVLPRTASGPHDVDGPDGTQGPDRTDGPDGTHGADGSPDPEDVPQR